MQSQYPDQNLVHVPDHNVVCDPYRLHNEPIQPVYNQGPQQSQQQFCSFLPPSYPIDVESQRIPQLDGAITDLFDFEQPLSRTAPYTLNREKQMDKIRSDANIEDFEVTVNNDDQNVTIKCSSGFYIQVGRASFVTTAPGSTFSKNNVLVSLDKVTDTKDKKGQEATKLLYYTFKSVVEHLGGVAVHLHHSNRTIQIQGSCIMPDSTRAALWFLNNVVNTRFNEMAKSKKFEIKNFNEAARKSSKSKPTLNNKTCNFCSQIFSGRAKPSQCGSCQEYFHTKTCLKNHVKNCKKSSPPSTLPSYLPGSSTSSSSSSIPLETSRLITRADIAATSRHRDTNSIPGLRSSITVVTASSTPSTETPSSMSLEIDCPGSQNSARRATTTVVQSSSSSASVLPASLVTSSSASAAPLSIPGPSHSSFQPDPNHIRTSVGKRKQKSIPISAADHTIETLKKELSAAQSRIVLLDSEIKDKDQELSVLWTRIKILEEKQNKDIIDQYFPHPESKRDEASRKEPSPPPPPSSWPHGSDNPPTTGTSSDPPAQCSCFTPLNLCSRISCLTGIFLPTASPMAHCSQTSQSIHQGCSTAASNRLVQTNKEEIEKLKEKVNQLNMRTKCDTSSTSCPPPVSLNLPSSPPSHPLAPSTSRPVTASSQSELEQGFTPEVLAATPNDTVTLDDSRASIEEFMDDIETNFPNTPSLNCQVPTSQQQLMLH